MVSGHLLMRLVCYSGTLMAAFKAATTATDATVRHRIDPAGCGRRPHRSRLYSSFGLTRCPAITFSDNSLKNKIWKKNNNNKNFLKMPPNIYLLLICFWNYILQDNIPQLLACHSLSTFCPLLIISASSSFFSTYQSNLIEFWLFSLSLCSALLSPDSFLTKVINFFSLPLVRWKWYRYIYMLTVLYCVWTLKVNYSFLFFLFVFRFAKETNLKVWFIIY